MGHPYHSYVTNYRWTSFTPTKSHATKSPVTCPRPQRRFNARPLGATQGEGVERSVILTSERRPFFLIDKEGISPWSVIIPNRSTVYVCIYIYVYVYMYICICIYKNSTTPYNQPRRVVKTARVFPSFGLRRWASGIGVFQHWGDNRRRDGDNLWKKRWFLAVEWDFKMWFNGLWMGYTLW